MLAAKREQKRKRNLILQSRQLSLLTGIALSTVVLVVFIVSINPGISGNTDVILSNAIAPEQAESGIDSSNIASRIIEQKFQIHMEEADQELGEIPYVEVWVLNDPFYPLIGEVGDLRGTESTISGKEWQMLGFPDYEQEQQTAASMGASTSQNTLTTQAATSAQKVVVVESIYEVRGVRYAIIKVNDRSYDRLKAGSGFAEVFKVQEIKDEQTVSVLCGDETYELRVNQLRKI